MNEIDEATALFLVSDDGRQLLEEVAAMPGDAPNRALTLRKRGLALEIVAGAVEVAEARRRARNRFAEADRLFFTRESLAQATSIELSLIHASLLEGLGTVADLGCGVGLDAIAIASVRNEVIAIERDPARLVFARANAKAYRVASRIRFVLGDVTTLDWHADAVFWDPARRTSAGDGNVRRVSRYADQYEPPLSFLETIRQRAPRGGIVKLSPALPDDVLRDLAGDTGAVLFLSENRECKEACLQWGEARRKIASGFAALLPSGDILPAGDPPLIADSPGAFVYDPDPAAIRAGALAAVCKRLHATLLTPDDAYLTGNVYHDTLNKRVLASRYRVIETMPYNPRAVGRRLKELEVGRLVVKKRHFPREPDAVARELGLSGKGIEKTLILSRDGKGFLAVLCEPVVGTSHADL